MPFDKGKFNGLTARQWWNRLAKYNPQVAMDLKYDKHRLSAQQLAKLQNCLRVVPTRKKLYVSYGPGEVGSV